MPSQILTEIAETYQSATLPWFERLFPIAQRLFLALATIELTWSGIWWALASRQDDTVLPILLRKVVTLMFFYTLLLFAPTWIPAIVQSFRLAGAHAAGISRIDPSSLIDAGLDIAVEMVKSGASILGILNLPLWLLVAPLVVVISFSVIAGILLMTLIESYIVIGGGVLLLGFGGSRWTVGFSEGYLVGAVRVGIKLFVLYLLIGLGTGLFEIFFETVKEADPGDPRIFWEVMGASLIYAIIIWRVPEFAAQIFSGTRGLYLDRVYRGSE